MANLSLYISEKFNEIIALQNNLIFLNSTRENIIKKFNQEYEKLRKVVCNSETPTVYQLRREIKTSTKMKKYQKELSENRELRKSAALNIKKLKREIYILNKANSTISN